MFCFMCIHTWTHSQKHACKHLHAHMYIDACKPLTHAHPCAHTHMHTHIVHTIKLCFHNIRRL